MSIHTLRNVSPPVSKVAKSPKLTPEEIKSLRAEKGWSQRKLAMLTGISQGLISMMENGTRTITADNELILRRTFDYF